MSTPSAADLAMYLDGNGLQRFWNNKIGDVSSLTGITGSTLVAKLSTLDSEKQDEHTKFLATLTVAGWSNKTQTITVPGVTASNLVIVGAAPFFAETYGEAGIKCTAQAADSLTFVCEEVPEEAISVNVAIFD